MTRRSNRPLNHHPADYIDPAWGLEADGDADGVPDATDNCRGPTSQPDTDATARARLRFRDDGDACRTPRRLPLDPSESSTTTATASPTPTDDANYGVLIRPSNSRSRRTRPGTNMAATGSSTSASTNHPRSASENGDDHRHSPGDLDPRSLIRCRTERRHHRHENADGDEASTATT